MTPPRKRQNLEEIKLVPEKDFEKAMRAVLGASRERVNERLTEEEKGPSRGAPPKHHIK